MADLGFYAFSSALWLYMTPQVPKPSIHDIVTGFFSPNSSEISTNILAGFGATINIISNGLECNTSDGVESTAAQTRAQYY